MRSQLRYRPIRGGKADYTAPKELCQENSAGAGWSIFISPLHFSPMGTIIARKTKKGRNHMETAAVTHSHPHRRRKTKLEIFKEAYLPYLILMSSAVVIVTFILGAVS